jgi:hypothetical protein
MRCQWHLMDKIFLLDSPFKYIYFCSGGVGQFAYINVLIDIPYKGCQGLTNCSSIVHAVSMKLHARCMQCHWHRINLLFFCISKAFSYNFHFSKLFESFNMHAVSMTPHALWHWMHGACGANDTEWSFKNSIFFANSNLYLKRKGRTAGEGVK